jgi:hypothetical protein
MKLVTDLSKGILGNPDSPEMWQEITSHITDSMLLKPGIRILNVACGHCTEAVILAKRMLALNISKKDVQKSIWLIDKYHVFTNHAAATYGFKNVVTADFMSWNTKMKFDIVVGNPPYQAPPEIENSKKLYLDFVKKSITLLTDHGKAYFITPQAILVDSKITNSNKLLSNHLEMVNYHANEYFNVGQKVIAWCYSMDPVTNITVIDKTIRRVNSLDQVSSDDNQMLLSILNKVDYQKNGHSKLKILEASDKQYIAKENLYLNKKANSIEVICHYANNPIQYCDEKYAYSPGWQLIIPYIGGWDNGCKISNKPTSKSVFVNKDSLTKAELETLKTYVESKLIKFCVLQFAKIKPAMGYAFLRRLPDINLSKKWTDKALYKYFNLTPEEITYIESNVK